MVLGIELAVVLAFLLHLGKACANSLDEELLSLYLADLDVSVWVSVRKKLGLDLNWKAVEYALGGS